MSLRPPASRMSRAMSTGSDGQQPDEQRPPAAEQRRAG